MSNTVEVVCDEHKFQLSLLENCSVSKFIEENKVFYELPFLKKLAQMLEPGDWIIDAGAHVGNHSIYLAAIHNVNSLAIEANPRAFNCIKSNIKLNAIGNKIIPVNRALYGAAETAKLSHMEPNNECTFSIFADDNESSFECKSTTLDQHLDFFADKSLKFIKLDIEGAETDALQHGTELIDKHRPEISTEVLSVKSFESLLKLLKPLGYAPYIIMNPSPTVFWTSDNKLSMQENIEDIFRYSIDKAMNYNIAARKSHDANLSRTKAINELDSMKSKLKESLDNFAKDVLI